jgi:exodeoxyribonuclease V gamma subunit
VELKDLVLFFQNPSSYILKKRLGLSLGMEDMLPEDHEPFDLKGLNRYLLGQELSLRGLRGEDLRKSYPAIQASGRLPHGAMGRFHHEELVEQVEAFLQGVRAFQMDPLQEPREAVLNLGRFRLTGILDDIYEPGMVLHRFAAIKAKDRLNAWIRHLFFNCMDLPAPRDPVTLLVGLPRGTARATGWTGLRYAPVENAPERLTALLELFWEGLREPLPFFPETSCTYAANILNQGKSPAEALVQAKRVWDGSDFTRGDSQGPYTRLCFKNQAPLTTPRFHGCSLEVFGPLVDHEGILRPEPVD